MGFLPLERRPEAALPVRKMRWQPLSSTYGPAAAERNPALEEPLLPGISSKPVHFSRSQQAGDILAVTPIRVPPTSMDVAIANAIAAHTGRPVERVAKTLTWGADEHILCALAGAWWIYCRNKDADRRRASNHVLLTTVVATALPHLLKTVFDQQRPDRTTVRGHWRGVPLSGNRLDSFPSGHAVHVGALASAATAFPERRRNLIWGIGAGLVLTRIVLLAHWASDVTVGLAVGASIERLLRHLTGYPRASVRTNIAGPCPAALGRLASRIGIHP
jgi:PAP2 superfamily